MRAISQSQINLYKSCPYSYKLKYVDGHEPMFYDPSIMYVGGAVHDAIDNYYKHCYTKDNDKAQILSLTYRYLRDNWDTTLPVEYLKKAYQCVCNFAEFEFNNQHELATKPLTEVKIYANDIMGIIDYVDLNNQVVIDWKTNAKASLGRSYKMQAIMYKKLMKYQFDVDIKKLRFQFLFVDEFRDVNFSNPKLLEIEHDLMLCKEQIKDAWRTLNFPKVPKAKNTCRWCNYRFYCKEM